MVAANSVEWCCSVRWAVLGARSSGSSPMFVCREKVKTELFFAYVVPPGAQPDFDQLHNKLILR